MDLREEGAFNLLNTVRQEMEGFTSHEVSEAKEAFALQHRTGNSSNEQLMRMVRSGNLRDTKPNLPQSMSDPAKIFGSPSDLGNKRGKTTRQKAPCVDSSTIKIP